MRKLCEGDVSEARGWPGEIGRESLGGEREIDLAKRGFGEGDGAYVRGCCLWRWKE